MRHLPFGIAGDRHGFPLRVFAPQSLQTWLAPLGGWGLMAASTAVSHPTLTVALGAGPSPA